MDDITLAVLPSDLRAERLTVALRRDASAGSALVLTQQSWSDGLGWFNQATLELSPEQVRELKAALRVEAISLSAGQASTRRQACDEVVSLPFAQLARAESA